MADPLSTDKLFNKIDEAEDYRKQAIELLLAQREEINHKLARLGYTGGAAQVAEAKKRIRRTKTESQAAMATEQTKPQAKAKKTGDLGGEG